MIEQQAGSYATDISMLLKIGSLHCEVLLHEQPLSEKKFIHLASRSMFKIGVTLVAGNRG